MSCSGISSPNEFLVSFRTENDNDGDDDYNDDKDDDGDEMTVDRMMMTLAFNGSSSTMKPTKTALTG